MDKAHERECNMKKIGIVFAGGGGKGAYEIGVWKYLNEVGLDQCIHAVSGTSVGALNAALFVGSSYELAENLWLNVTPEKILSPRKLTPEEIIQWLDLGRRKVNSDILKKVGKASIQVASSTAFAAGKIAQALLMRIRADYLFSRDGLTSMIGDGLNFQQLQSSEIPCFVTCLRCSDFSVDRFRLNYYSSDEVTKLLLASSAIPIVFPNEEFDGCTYCDGGVPVIGDNIPIDPIYDMGMEYIIVIHLNQDTVVDKKAYTNSHIIEIVPSQDLGNALTGTLDFTPEGSKRRIELGYLDAKRTIQPMIDMLRLNFENQMILNEAIQNMYDFDKKRAELNKQKLDIRRQMENDGFDDIYADLMKEK